MTVILQGHCIDKLREMPDEVVHCVVTSPPYWSLRDYGIRPVRWEAARFAPAAGLPEIEIPEQEAVLGLEKDPWAFVGHIVAVFREVRRVLRSDGTLWLNFGDSFASSSVGTGGKSAKQVTNSGSFFNGSGMRTDGNGLKPGDRVGMPWRVALALQADGWYLRQENIWAKSSPMPESLNGWRWERCKVKIAKRDKSLASEYRLSRAETEGNFQFTSSAQWRDCPGCPKCETSPIQGFVLRQPAWRPTTAHEQIFLFSKSKTYYADREAVATEAKAVSKARAKRGNGDEHKLVAGAPGQIAHSMHAPRENKQDGVGKPNYTGFNARYTPVAKANLRSVWHIKKTAFMGKHFATFPPGLPELCIKAGTSEAGVCPICEAPLVRVIEKGAPDLDWQRACGGGENGEYSGESKKDHDGAGVQDASAVKARILSGMAQKETIGWFPTCGCEAEGPPLPAVVLDPFSGAGTTPFVAEMLGRAGVGIEINEDYLKMAENRLAGKT